MNRLLQGEVGSGKTLVALRAMLRVVDSGGQAALLAPTEVLAQQHHRSITADARRPRARAARSSAPATGTRVELLTGSMTKTQRTGAAARGIASGEAGIVIGTHALLQDQVQFADLGLVVVDEQHRFGVEQRAALTDKAQSPPHLLVMTATPIPRTVAMTVFGDLETSTLTELPAGRAPIQTNVVPLAEQPGAGSTGSGSGSREEVEQGPPGLRRLPADLRRRGRGGRARAWSTSTRTATPVDRAPRRPRRGRGGRAAAGRRARSPGSGSARLHGRLPAGREGRDDAGLRRAATSTSWSRPP